MWPFDQLRRLFGARPEMINTEAANDRQAVRNAHEVRLETAVTSLAPTRDARGRFIKRRAF